MTQLVYRIALPLCVLGGCTQTSSVTRSTPPEMQVINFAHLKPGMNFVTFTSFADGRLALEDGCFRLKKGQTNLAIVWPETVRMAQKGKSVRIDDIALRWSAKVGDRIRLGGKASDDISAVNLDNKAVLACAAPYFVASNIIRR